MALTSTWQLSSCSTNSSTANLTAVISGVVPSNIGVLMVQIASRWLIRIYKTISPRLKFRNSFQTLNQRKIAMKKLYKKHCFYGYSAFNFFKNTPASLTDLSQYVNSPGRRAHWYTELTVSSPAVAEIIASTHSTCPRRGGQAEWAWINTGMVD